MPRVSAAEQLQRRMIADLEHKAFSPEVPAYVQHRCLATLATLLRRRDKRLAVKSAAADARRAERDAAAPKPWLSVLPNNGRTFEDKPVSLAPLADDEDFDCGIPNLKYS
jgi:hypothetical protein